MKPHVLDATENRDSAGTRVLGQPDPDLGTAGSAGESHRAPVRVDEALMARIEAVALKTAGVRVENP